MRARLTLSARHVLNSSGRQWTLRQLSTSNAMRFCQSLNTSEVSQIGNVDVSVNVDVESHPVGSFALQIFEFQGKKKMT